MRLAKLKGMDVKPSPQPFSCHVCHLNFSGGKQLAQHLEDKHEPHFNAEDKAWLRSIKIQVED